MYSDKNAASRRPRREERFMDKGDAQGQRRRAYERKSRIFKRNREQLDAKPEQRIVQILLELNETMTPERFEEHVGSITERLAEFMERNSDMLQECLMDCVVELPAKTPHYAALTRALWMTERSSWVEEFVERVKETFCSALTESELIRSRLLFRFLVSLVAAGVVDSASVRTMLSQMVEATIAVAQSTEDRSGRSWQPYTDFLIYCSLIALPWGTAAVFENAVGEWDVFSQKVVDYIRLRPIQTDNAAKPFLAAIKENDCAAQSDSGGASFVAELWSAIQDLQSSGNWQCNAVPRTTLSQTKKMADKPLIVVKDVSVPTSLPGCVQEVESVAKRAAVMKQRYPHRGGICLLEAQHTHPNATEIDKIIVEDYILDTLTVYQGNRADCVQRITHDIPSPFPICPLVAQTLFSQLLLLPKPPLLPVAYSAVIINLCKVTDEAWSVFPRGLSACIREVFARMSVLDPELMDRTADWLALHLSNLGFMWPWSKWKKVVDASERNAQRLFVQRVLKGLVDLSYRKLVQDNLSPVDFHTLLPPDPVAKSFDQLFKQGTTPTNEPTEGADLMEVDDERQLDEEKSDHVSKMQLLRQLISSKERTEVVKEQFVQELAGNQNQTAAFAKDLCRVLILSGDKNVTHTENILTRYQPLVTDVMDRVGDLSQTILVDALMDVWSNSMCRACLVLTVLMKKQMISPSAVVEWGFNHIRTRLDEDNQAVADLWDVVKCGLLFVEAGMKEAEREKANAAMRVQHAKECAQDAAKRGAEAAERVESGNSDVQEMLDAINEANAAEAKARLDVAEAEEHLRLTDSDIMNEATERFQNAFLQVYGNFLLLLKEKPQIIPGGSSSDNQCRTYYRVLSRFGAFCRQHSGRIVNILDELESALDASGADKLVIKVAWNSLCLGRDIDQTEALYEASYFIKKKEPTSQSAGKSDAQMETA